VRVLITGWEGFIGRNALRILSDDFEMIPYEGDIRDFKISEYYYAVLHLAALAGVRKSWNNPDEYWDVNVTGSKRVFDECKRLNLRCVYASSSSIYEWWANPYATSKKAMEELAPNYSVGMRFHTVYGPDSRPDMFYDMMLNDKVEYLTEHKRDWTHVEDVVSAIKIILTDTRISGKMDIGTGNPVSVIDVAREYGYRDVPIREVTGERFVTHADNSQLKELGWTPKFDIMKEVKNERIKRTVSLGGKVSSS
jgi:nucleoside-diphosphate-sugar epimerase